MAIYQKLYPNLNFGGKLGQSTLNLNRARSCSPKMEALPEPKRVIIPETIVEPKIEVSILPEIAKEIVIEPVPVAKDPEPTVVIEAPNKCEGTIESEKLPEPEVRPTPKPTGKRVAKFTEEERRDKYLERLSKRSVKNAEKEMQNIETILQTCEYKNELLDKSRKDLKRQLKLINTAKFFANK